MTHMYFDELSDRERECGDEGHLCDACQAKEEAFWRDIYKLAPLSETNPDKYAQELRDAGRGHLIRD